MHRTLDADHGVAVTARFADDPRQHHLLGGLELDDLRGLRKVRAEKLKARQEDKLCDQFNVTAV